MTPRTSVCHTVLTSLRHVCAHVHTLVRVCVCVHVPKASSLSFSSREMWLLPGVCVCSGSGAGAWFSPQTAPKFPERSELTKTKRFWLKVYCVHMT